MEVFRTDGGGRSYANERLFNLVLKVDKNVNEGFFDNIILINDHKGDLNVHIKDDIEIDYIYSVFQTFWYINNEYNVSIYYNGVCDKGANLGDDWDNELDYVRKLYEYNSLSGISVEDFRNEHSESLRRRGL